MTNKTEAFKRDCRIVNMKMEYPGYTGEIMWIVVSDLTEEERNRRRKELEKAAVALMKEWKK